MDTSNNDSATTTASAAAAAPTTTAASPAAATPSSTASPAISLATASATAVPANATVPSVTPTIAPPSPAAPTPTVTAVATAPHGAVSPPQQRGSDAPPSHEPATKHVVVPRCSTWFALDAINPIEKRMLPEFFVRSSGPQTSKTPQIYVKYRNFMVLAYRQQPHVFLTATACRRNLAGDACAILRVHEFLTHWGLINYSVPPHAMPPSTHATYALQPVDGGALVSNTTTTTTPLAVVSDAVAPSLHMCDVCGHNAVTFALSLDGKRKALDAAALGTAHAAGVSNTTTSSNGPLATGNATSGGGVLTLGAFCAAPGAGLCDDCFLNRAAFPPSVDATDFVHVGSVASNRTTDWTATETTALLEAVAGSSSDANANAPLDWNVVAAKVRTKTANECLLQFLALPIGAATNTSNTSTAVPTFTYAETMNAPVVNLAALLAHVDPFVAKAAAQAAMRAIQTLQTLPVIPNHTTTATDVDAVMHDVETDAVKNERTTFADAAAAVKQSAIVAGIADAPIKKEDNNTDNNTDNERVPVSNEAVAVAHEAASATTAALLAVRANTIANETANGPIRGLVTELVQNQLTQIELKFEQLRVLERAVAAERDALQQATYELYVDRLAFAQEKLGQSAVAGAAGSSSNS